ncbi:MAG: hypothetical protein ACRDZ3_05325 [Acidimicrobiia bacterium]
MRRISVLIVAALMATLNLPAYGAEDDPKPEDPKQETTERETCPGHRDDPREQIVGTDSDDVLFVPEGGLGCGLGGDDLLRSDKHGNTRLYGGDGDDVFCAENNDPDAVHGGDGEDRARSDEAEDTLRDVEGDTVLIGCAARR